MKTKKLLKQLVDLLDGDIRRKKKEYKALREVLKKLKEKERNLVRDRAQERHDDERDRLRKAIDVVHAQRKKGLKLLRRE